MKIEQVKIVDFLTVSNIETRLDDLGIVAIMGVNKVDTAAESNGSGKSSFADAICWCLWGSTARGEAGDEIIRSGEKGAFVSVVVYDEMQDERYCITRERTKGKTSLKVEFLDEKGALHDRTSGTIDLTQKTIAQIMGCSESVFRSVVYLGQEEMPDLPKMTDKALKEIVEEAAGVQSLYAAHELAKEAHKKAVSAKEAAQQEVNSRQSKIEDHRSSIEVIAESIEAEKESVKGFRLALEQDVANCVERISVLREQASDEIFEEAKKRVDTAVDDFRKYTEAEKKDQEIESEVSRALGGIGMMRRNLDAQKKLVASKKAEMENIHSRIGKPCGECGTIITEATMEVAKDHALSAFKSSLETAKTMLHELKTAEADLEKKRSALPVVSGETEDKSLALAEARRRFEEIQRMRAAIPALEGEKALAEKRLVDTISRPSPLVAKLESLKKELELSKFELDASTLALSEAEKHEEECKEVVSVFGPAGVRAHILDQVTPMLNERTAFYMTALTDGKISAVWSTLTTNSKGELREKFSIDVKHEETGKKFKGLSGGEKRRVRLACAFALQDLVATRANKPIHLMITDEIDDALDIPGLERLMSVMQDKARERGTVMVISHNDLKSWIGECWTITKTTKGSVLSDDR